MAAYDPALDVASTTVPARDESDDQHGRVIIVDREFVEENRVLAQQNIALAIVAQQNKQRGTHSDRQGLPALFGSTAEENFQDRKQR